MVDNLYGTATVQLGEAGGAHASGQVVVSRSGEALSTDSIMPRDLVAGPDNPEAVSGYAGMREFAGSDDVTSLEPGDDGRYFLPRVIIGADDRTQVAVPAAWPFAVQGHLQMTFPNGQRYIGSGTMIGRHHVITAGHCVYSSADGGWATQMTFEAARNGNNRPFGTQSAIRLMSVTGWTQQGSSDFDMGMLILDSDVGDRTGYMGVITGPDTMLQRYRVNVTGYPGDKGGTTLWTHADVIKAVAAERIGYDIDTMGGQSGSGVWSSWAGHQGEKVCAIHTTGAASGNGGTRISRGKFDRIVDWLTNY
ncbi:MAG: protease, family [Bradyrhizobium sp.]|nr:protease, family [Bradyrhizobium sp.]